MTQNGLVVEKEEGRVLVAFDRPEACANCGACLRKNCTRTWIEGEAEVGDMVDVEMPAARVVGASALAYLLPLAGLVAGLFIGSALYEPMGVGMPKDFFTALCGLLTLAIAAFGVWRVDKRLRRKQSWKPQIVRVYKAGG